MAEHLSHVVSTVLEDEGYGNVIIQPPLRNMDELTQARRALRAPAPNELDYKMSQGDGVTEIHIAVDSAADLAQRARILTQSMLAAGIFRVIE